MSSLTTFVDWLDMEHRAILVQPVNGRANVPRSPPGRKGIEMKRKDEHNPYFKHCSCPACKPVQPAQEVEPSTPHIPIMSLGECIKAESVAASGQAGKLDYNALQMLAENKLESPIGAHTIARVTFDEWTFTTEELVDLMVQFAQEVQP